MARRICGILALLPAAVIGLAHQQQQQNNNNGVVNGGVSFGSLLTDSIDTNSAVLVDSERETTLNTLPSWQYWCDSCACGFNKLKSYKEHNSGKLHLAIVVESESVWEEYKSSGPAFYDASVSRADVTRAWSLNMFVEGLPARSRSSLRKTVSGHSTGASGGGGQIDPNLMLRDLPPVKRVMLWRFLGGISPQMTEMVAVLPPQFARVKELLESAEAFSHVERLVKRSNSHGVKAKRISHVYDIGCGHGLVGMLCASAFPSMKVHSLDREPRESFQAQLEAFASSTGALDNLSFQAGDLADLELVGGTKDGTDDEHGDCLLLCVHGCKSLTHESIELAIRKQWAWLAIPCCLQVEHHLDGTSLKLSDDTRFALLCGALALRHQAETVASIDPRITARGIVLSSSGLKCQNVY
jgi:hypothetical protein